MYRRDTLGTGRLTPITLSLSFHLWLQLHGTDALGIDFFSVLLPAQEDQDDGDNRVLFAARREDYDSPVVPRKQLGAGGACPSGAAAAAITDGRGSVAAAGIKISISKSVKGAVCLSFLCCLSERVLVRSRMALIHTHVHLEGGIPEGTKHGHICYPP